MSTLTSEVKAIDVRGAPAAIAVDLSGGRTIIVSLGWYPRLAHATERERKNWKFTGRGEGIHWSLLDEDVSVKNLLDGRPSGESQRSVQRWLDERRQSARKKV